MLNTLELGHDLLGGRCYQLFHLPGGGAGKGNKNIGESNIDLWLLLARCDRNSKHTKEQTDQGQQRCYFGGQKPFGSMT